MRFDPCALEGMVTDADDGEGSKVLCVVQRLGCRRETPIQGLPSLSVCLELLQFRADDAQRDGPLLQVLPL